MNVNDLKKNKTIFWILHASGWILLNLIYLFLYYRNYISDPKSILSVFLTYFVGFFISLGLRYFYQKIKYQDRSISQLSFIVLISSIVAAQFWFWSDIGLSIPLNDAGWYRENITLQMILSSTWWHSFILLTWSALYFLIKLWGEWTVQKERTEKANALAQSAQLKMLRYQLNPHFLFNSLNSIRALIDENQKHAKDMITELSEFLRYSLVSKDYSDVPLKEELEAIRHYFKIEKKRFEEKLEIEYHVNPLAEEYPVLSFLIHPLVENAVKYGMKTSAMPLRISINADVIKESLVLEICNSGIWIDHDSDYYTEKQSADIGLNNIRQRLENAYPDHYSFEIQKETDHVCIKIVISKIPGSLNGK